ncbi:MAG: prepilin-type N-terminal cleavage/methylation domain-containing protein [Pseudomonadota bacterium]
MNNHFIKKKSPTTSKILKSGIRSLEWRKNGFSLPELIIAMGIGLFVLLTMYDIFILQNKMQTGQGRINDMQQNARAGLYVMAQDIRMAGTGILADILAGTGVAKCTGTSPSATPCRGIVSASPNSIIFTASVPTVQIQYNLQGNPTILPVAGPGVPLLRTGNPVAQNITSLNFTYYDISGNPMSSVNNLENIREIAITITSTTSNLDPATRTYKTFTLTTKVNPRNLYY